MHLNKLLPVLQPISILFDQLQTENVRKTLLSESKLPSILELFAGKVSSGYYRYMCTLRMIC